MDDRGNLAVAPVAPRAGSARTAWAWATFAVLAPTLLILSGGVGLTLLFGVVGGVVALALTFAGGRDGAAAGPAPDPVPAPVRAIDIVWLALLGRYLPFMALGPGSACENCSRVSVGVGITWAGVGLAFLAYLTTFLPGASPRRARVVAGTFVPATLLVVVAGMTVATG